jgi:hypothetical protein
LADAAAENYDECVDVAVNDSTSGAIIKETKIKNDPGRGIHLREAEKNPLVREGGEGGTKVGEKNGRVSEGGEDEEESFGFDIDYVVDHRTISNEATLGMVDAVVCVGGEGLLGGVGERLAISVGKREGAERGRRGGNLEERRAENGLGNKDE